MNPFIDTKYGTANVLLPQIGLINPCVALIDLMSHEPLLAYHEFAAFRAIKG